MLSQVDSEGHQYQIFTDDTYLKKDDITIIKVNGLIRSINRNLHQKNTTHGWKLLVVCKDSSVGWVYPKRT